MSDDTRVLRLIEEVVDSGRSPEEVCTGVPHLLPAVRAGWARCRQLNDRLDDLFLSSRRSYGSGDGGGPAHELARSAALPDIPGYEIETVLGRGGVGVVYRARHLRLGRTVALKMLLSGAHAGGVERVRFLGEARAVAALHHPNIVQVHDVGEHGGQSYFTMEFVEGGNLAQKLAGMPQPAREGAELLTILARAVQSAHDAGIVHRDLKLGNVLLTADGTPKITDFGLARNIRDEGGLTWDGERVGTPSYMAPEQAAGKLGCAGPPADVYSLGAILYELLTGRPPFRAETAAATLQQVILDEPAPPSRLNARVPRDLETICLKCLRKAPERRYESAAALADDLLRFRQGRPIRARTPGRVERLWRWTRREPTAAALLATTVIALGLIIGGGWLLERQRAAGRAAVARQEGRTWQAVETSLTQAATFQEQGRWPEAMAALKGAPDLRGTPAPAGLVERLSRARSDAEMAGVLEEIRLRMSESGRGRNQVSRTVDQSYGEAFAHYGIDLYGLDPADAAERVRASAIRATLVVFLHDWLYWASDATRDRVRSVLNLADDDPWRRAFRDAVAASDVGQLKALAQTPGSDVQPPVVLSGLGGTLLSMGQREQAWALLRGAQRRHPGDFWINYLLGQFLKDKDPQEAVGYLRAAVSARSTSDQAYTQLGRALREMGDATGAVDAFEKARSLNPRLAGAAETALTLVRSGDLKGARDAWEAILEADPPDHESWHGYAQLCLFLGNEDAYRRARTALLNRFGDNPGDWLVAERTALAAMLLPASGEEIRRAARLASRAAELSSRTAGDDNPFVNFVLGLAEYRQGRPAAAVPFLKRATVKIRDRAGPRLVLAMAQFRSGDVTDARKTLAAAVRNFDWHVSGDERLWVSDVLRREAEAMILPTPPEGGRPARSVGAVAGPEPAHAAVAPSQVGDDIRARVKALAPGRLEEGRGAWEQIISDDDPLDHDAWNGYAELCLFLENEPEYRRARTALLDRFADHPANWMIAERTATTALLVADSGDELRRAAALADLASAAASTSGESGNPYIEFVVGLAQYRQGRLDRALPLLKSAAAKLHDRPTAGLVLAMAEFKSGAAGQARHTLAVAVRSYNWDAAAADQPLAWTSHLLRREAEALILPNLSAFLEGRYRPGENDERLALMGICKFKELHCARARLWNDAFAADPALFATGRESAVRAAGLAGCGIGVDSAKLDPVERARWRSVARQWFEAELASASNSGRMPETLANLRAWLRSPDLAGVREPAALERLPAAERREWRALWRRAENLVSGKP